MINFKEIPHDTDGWELFIRDYLVKRGFSVESPPDRGPDGGKDILVTEQIPGKFNNYEFRWLVSCKHFATSGRAVSESDEHSVLERVKSFKADGFLGAYSTLVSSGLNTRLLALKREGEIKDYSIIDHRIIENELVTVGFSDLMMRYFPESYKSVKPLHFVGTEYIPLPCENCGEDLLLELFREDYKANIIFVETAKSERTSIEHIYCVHKGDCDRGINQKYSDLRYITSWEDISDLVIPVKYMSWLFALMNQIRKDEISLSDEAYEKLKLVIHTLAQKVFRHTTEKEYDRSVRLAQIPQF
jgi:hypothetical protein